MSPLRIGPVSHERILKVFVALVITILIIGYACYQARNLIQGPTITLSSTGGTVHHTRTIDLVGTAHNVVVLRLNGREIHTDERGNFTHTLMLEEGFSITTLEAEDRYGRKTVVERQFVYEPDIEERG